MPLSLFRDYGIVVRVPRQVVALARVHSVVSVFVDVVAAALHRASGQRPIWNRTLTRGRLLSRAKRVFDESPSALSIGIMLAKSASGAVAISSSPPPPQLRSTLVPYVMMSMTSLRVAMFVP